MAAVDFGVEGQMVAVFPDTAGHIADSTVVVVDPCLELSAVVEAGTVGDTPQAELALVAALLEILKLPGIADHQYLPKHLEALPESRTVASRHLGVADDRDVGVEHSWETKVRGDVVEVGHAGVGKFLAEEDRTAVGDTAAR